MDFKAIIAKLEAFLNSDSGQSARKRLATKGSESTFVGADGITRKSQSKPLGAFWEIPDDLAVEVDNAVKVLAEMKANKYLPFELSGQRFEVGSVGPNQLTKKYEIWFAKAGLLGSHTISTDELLSALLEQKVERMVAEIDTTGMTSVTSKVKEPITTTESKLPF